MNNTLFGKTMENVRKHRDNKLTTTESRRCYLQFEPNYRNAKFFTENILATEMRKSGIRRNKTCRFRIFYTRIKRSINVLVFI